VIDLTRVVYDLHGRAVEVMLAVIAADTVQLSLNDRKMSPNAGASNYFR
jgi:hypothetical protein